MAFLGGFLGLQSKKANGLTPCQVHGPSKALTGAEPEVQKPEDFDVLSLVAEI